jgi:hypothetical protein
LNGLSPAIFLIIPEVFFIKVFMLIVSNTKKEMNILRKNFMIGFLFLLIGVAILGLVCLQMFYLKLGFR